MKATRLLAAGLVAAAAIPTASALASRSDAKAAAGGTRVTVRVEGLGATLVHSKAVSTHAQSVDPDGNPADTCTGNTAAVALQDATHGHWTAGTYSSSLGYPVVAIEGESHSFSSPYYWAFWVNGKPSSTGICQAALHAGDAVLFFPQCSAQAASGCPQGLFNPVVLELKGPATASVGKSVPIAVHALSNTSGKPTKASGLKVQAAGRAVKVQGGSAHLKFAHPGTYKVTATASDAIRDELTIVVRAGG